MNYVLILVGQLITMFLYMAVGFCLYKKELITDTGSKALSNLLLYVILPGVILRSFAQECSPEKTIALLASLGLAALVLLISMVISSLCFRRDPAANFGSAFSNAGFMGIPLISAVLGKEAVFYVAGMVALLNILQWTYGQAILFSSKKDLNIKAILKNPLVVSFGLGLVLYALPVSLPEQIHTAIDAFAACNAPVAMIVLGVMLGKVPFSQLFRGIGIWKVSAVRLILIPIITLLVLSCFSQVSTDLRTALLISAVAPVGSNLAVYLQKLGKDGGESVKMICLSTILSAVTMPLVLLLASSLWN